MRSSSAMDLKQGEEGQDRLESKEKGSSGSQREKEKERWKSFLKEGHNSYFNTKESNSPQF